MMWGLGSSAAAAMQASKSADKDVAEVLPMTDADALLEVVRRHQPDVVIPEIEALADVLDRQSPID